MVPEALRHPPGGKPWLLYLVLAGSVAFNIGVLSRYGSSTPEVPGVAAPAPVQAIGEATEVSNAPVPPELLPPLPTAQGSVSAPGSLHFTGAITRSLSDTFVAAPTSSPAALSAVFTRLFAWDVDMRRDLHKGDIVEVLFEQPATGEPVVLAAKLHLQPGSSGERIFTAYRYQAPGDAYPSYWSVEGQEVPRRLIDGPMENYEQITSLLKDRPTHAGMDFKTNIGTPIVTPRAGSVTRTNWNHAANGNCVEVQYQDGTLAKFLHLNENLVQAGQRVTAGTVVGKSGNTGHSTGPHLHYQLEQGGRVVDPIKYHGTLRRQLQPTAMPGFSERAVQLDRQLSQQVAVNP